MADSTAAVPSTLARLPSLLARRLPSAPSQPPQELAYLFHVARTHNPHVDLSDVERAYGVAARAHAGQYRHNGAPYITHPLAVATILASLGMPPTVLAAALLHDTVEDTTYQLDDLRGDFGDEIAGLVDAVTKIDQATAGQAAKAETVRKMVIAMAKDIRVLVMKLADRLHNARTYKYVPKESSRHRQARETLDIYVPLANRLGMGTVKRELEDLCFATLDPTASTAVARQVADLAHEHDDFGDGMIEEIARELEAASIAATVASRPRHNYSVYQAMSVREGAIVDYGDICLIQVLTNSVADCYLALGTLHGTWRPLPNRFKDFVAAPKFNMYQSLHTTVLGADSKPVNVQIRTTTMHQRAEEGVAAYWKHAGDQKGTHTSTQPESSTSLSWLEQLMDWQNETQDSGEFLESLRIEMDSEEVFLFTPAGEIVTLPAGATSVDFAYSIHTDVGHRAIGALVNKRLVPLESALDNGDVVEILTAKDDGTGPSPDWLAFAKTARARNKIKQRLAKSRSGTQAEGKDPQPLNVDRPQPLAGQGPPTHKSRPPVVVSDRAHAASASHIRLARCCMPVPGDSVVAFQDRRDAISVHRSDCANVAALKQEHEPVAVEWAKQSDGSAVFLIEIDFEALDREGLLADTTRAISNLGINIMSAEVTAGPNKITTGAFTIELTDDVPLRRVLKKIRNVSGVYEVHRHGAEATKS
jgi:GTP pyrophosphokinase